MAQPLQESASAVQSEPSDGSLPPRLSRRAALLACFLIPLSNWRAFGAEGGRLTLNLDEWSGLVVRFKGQSVTITTSSIWDALRGR
jgi:hypothetical protein